MNAATTEPNDELQAAEPPAILDAPLPDTFAIETARLRLRPPREADGDELFAVIAASLAELAHWLPWCQNGYTRQACGEWLRKVVASWRASREFALIIEDRPSRRILGVVGLNRIDALGRWANLGYWLGTDSTGNGIATEAAAAIARFGFAELNLRRIEIFADVDNRASRRVAEKLAAIFEGVARNRASVGDRCRDAAVYSLIPGDLGD